MTSILKSCIRQKIRLSKIILNNASNVQAKPVTNLIFKFYLYQCLNFLPFLIIIDSA